MLKLCKASNTKPNNTRNKLKNNETKIKLKTNQPPTITREEREKKNETKIGQHMDLLKSGLYLSLVAHIYFF